jgi:hypothetical protein
MDLWENYWLGTLAPGWVGLIIPPAIDPGKPSRPGHPGPRSFVRQGASSGPGRPAPLPGGRVDGRRDDQGLNAAQGAVSYPCQNRRETGVIHGQTRGNVNGLRSGNTQVDPCLRRPSKQPVVRLRTRRG